MRRTLFCTIGVVLAMLASLPSGRSAHAATYTVINTNDSGAGSLRWAINQANATAGADTIEFNIPGAGVHTIQPLTPLPALVDDGTLIDGYSQPGSAPASGVTPAIILVEIDGSLSTNANGLVILSSDNVVRGLVINRFALNGIALGAYAGYTATFNLIVGNHIGTNAAGTNALGNGLSGVFIGLGANQNVVGGTSPAERNVLSGNGWEGVGIHGSGTRFTFVFGNYIGTDANGTASLGNGYYGVRIYGGAQDNVVGGYGGGVGNLISGNDLDGVRIAGAGTEDNLVAGNWIGTAAGGNSGLGNGGCGVYITLGAQGNTIGGNAALGLNIISGNHGEGVLISGTDTMTNTVSGNYIGTDASGTADLGNGDAGVRIEAGVGNRVGGGTANERNVISGNGYGVVITAAGQGNVVAGNWIGTTASGSAALGNTYKGVSITEMSIGNTIGGDTEGERNVISGNGDHGVFISGANTVSNTVAGNYIGVDVAGSAALGNATCGVYVGDGAQGTLVGGSTAGEGNVLSGNLIGVCLYGMDTMDNTVAGNLIGTTASGNAALGNSSHGVGIVSGASANLIGGHTAGAGNVISGNTEDGVYIHGDDATNNTIVGNFIGTDVTGSIDVGNGDNGIMIDGGAHGNVIGGSTAAEGNLISGNGRNGVAISGSSANTVSGNYIGTDTSGTAALSNALDGVWIGSGAEGNIVGGDTAGEGNLISGNGDDGISLDEAFSTTVRGNFIGTDASGLVALGNSDFGIYIGGGARGNIVGGSAPGQGNVITANGDDGIYVAGASTTGNLIGGNCLGTDATGTAALGNEGNGIELDFGTSGNILGPANIIAHNGFDGVFVDGPSTVDNDITQNSIHANTGKGIELVEGAHGGILPPAITAVTVGPGSVTIEGTACPGCTVEVFSNGDTDGEGEHYIGSAAADGGGNFTLVVGSLGEPYLTATATDAADGTSEFSAVYTATISYVVNLPVVVRSYAQ